MGDFDVNKPVAVMDLWSAISLESGVDRQVCKHVIIEYTTRPSVDVINIMASHNINSAELSRVIVGFNTYVRGEDRHEQDPKYHNSNLYIKVGVRCDITPYQVRRIVEEMLCDTSDFVTFVSELRMKASDIRNVIKTVDSLTKVTDGPES